MNKKTIIQLLIGCMLVLGWGESWGQTTVSYDFSAGGAVAGLNEASPGISLDANIGFGSFKNSGTSNPGIFSEQLRLYQNATKGGSIKIYANNGVTITQVIVHASGTTGPAAYTVDGGSATDLSAGTTYTMSSLSATSVVEFYQKDGSSSNRIYVDDFEVFYTVASSTPTITVSPTTLSGFTYMEGSGPSAEQEFTVSGSNLTANISITAPTNYEISETSGSGFSSSITLDEEDEEVAETTIFVRLKAGLDEGLYNDEDISVTSTDADDKTVTCSGEVTVISSECGSETFDNIPTNSSTSYQSRSWTGDDGVTWTAEGARTDQTISGKAICWGNSGTRNLITPTYSNGMGLLEFDYVRAFTGTGARSLEVYVNNILEASITVSSTANDVETFSQEINVAGDIVLEIRSTGAAQVKVDNIVWECYVNTDPTITVSPTMLTNFSYIFGNGPSNEQSFTVSGSNIIDEIDITPPTNYEISTGTGGAFVATNPITLTQSDGDIAETSIYVRLKAGLSAGDYNSEDITASSTDATNKTVTCSGMVNPSIISVSETEITDFEYTYENGPSASKTFNVEGSNLTGSLIISAPVNYEISDDDVNFGTSVSLTPVSNQVSSTTIYVRMKAGLAIGEYNDEDITASSTGATNQTITCSGEVLCPSISDPTAIAPSSVSGSSFSANWDAVSTATGYKLDVYNLGAPASDLIISEYIEGSSNNKYIEIFNGTGAEVDLSDYALELFANGASSPTNTENLTGTLADGATLVFKNSSAAIYSGSTTNSSVCNFNGNDAIVLTKSGTDIDVIGTVGDASIFAEDVTLIRKAGVSSPNSTFDSGEWDSFAQDYEDLGTHLYSGGTSFHLENQDVGNLTSYDVTGLTAGETYYYVVRAYNGCGNESGDSNEITVNLTCSDPTTQASVLNFPDTQTDQMDIAWTNGDGDYRLVVASTSAITGTPTDNTSYTADANLSDGDVLNPDEYIVYAGSGNSVTITGLTSDTEYFIKVFEYNCDEGSEQYLTSSPLAGSETTVANIPAVTDFDVTCMTETTAIVEWTNPISGDWDGVAIAVRRGSNPPQVLSGFDVPSDLTVNTTFGNADSQYGNSPDYSYAIYKGTGTSVTVTGLTQGEDYVFKAFSYYDDGYDNTNAVTTTSITGLDINEVSSANATAGNGETSIGWANPTCYDEILVVGKDGGSITSTPSGDGNAYSADASFGVGSDIGSNEYVVYQGTGSSINVTSLTNDNTYYFKIFIRIGTEWSTGIEVFVVPADVTVLEGGDIAIISINTQYLSSGGDDEWCFISFKDITEGTSIDFTDNGYERVLEGLWGDTEGTIRLTRNSGGTIPAGTPICVQGAGNSDSNFTIINCGANDDANWSISSLNGLSEYNLNSTDQIWIFQNGSWDNPSGNHNADYTGNVVWGWTATGWEENENYASTSGSTVPPGSGCFNSNLNGFSSAGKYAYTGDMNAVTQIEWILRINDAANWSEYVDNEDYFNSGPDYANTCQNFSINPSGFTHGIWTAQKNTEWFECANWESLTIPDEETNVVISTTYTSENVVVNGSKNAKCNDITIESAIGLDFSNNTIEVHGNFNNQSASITSTNGTLLLASDDNVNITSNAASFYNIEVNGNGNFTLIDNLTLTGTLNLVNGLIETGENRVFVNNTTEAAITNHSNASYINGNLRRAIAATGDYDLPVGDASNYQLANINLNSSTGLTYLDANFNSFSESLNISSLSLQVNGTSLQTLLDAGNWTISPNPGMSDLEYNIGLYLRGATNTGADPAQHTIVKRSNSGTDWEIHGSHDNADQTISGGIVYAYRSNLNNFSDFAIAKHDEFILPVEILYFDLDCNSGINQLVWATASETNSDYFEIQKSFDGLRWNNIGMADAAGFSNSENRYSFEDGNINSSEYLYYRLKQFDFDGSYYYSKIIGNICETENSINISLYPNPCEANLYILIENSTDRYFNIEITDISGRIVYRRLIFTTDPYSHTEISTERLRSGMYFINFTNENSSIVKRFEKK